jgi:c-di-GMP-binding flagellar brake protein YcgR
VTNPAIPAHRKGVPKPTDAVGLIDSAAGAHEMRDPFDIGEVLEALAQSGEAVSVYPSRPGHPVLLARIHSVDPDNPAFILDFAGATPPAGNATLVASLGGNAKMQFELSQEWRGQSGQSHLVPAAFPASCLVLNRRAAQRLETPVGVNYTAAFKILGAPYELPLYDFSIGGVGMRATPEQAFKLRVGKKLEDVRLELGPALVMVADLEIRLLRPFRTFLLGEQVQVGCSFSSISMQMQQNLEKLVTARRKA